MTIERRTVIFTVTVLGRVDEDIPPAELDKIALQLQGVAAIAASGQVWGYSVQVDHELGDA